MPLTERPFAFDPFASAEVDNQSQKQGKQEELIFFNFLMKLNDETECFVFFKFIGTDES